MDEIVPQEDAVGVELRRLRARLGIGAAEAARRAGITPAALGHWEAGRRAPRGSALDALLAALEVPTRTRRRLLALADPAHARIVLSHDPHGAPIDPGMVLRALRLRRGLTQTELGSAVGVTQGAVARWESGGSLPDGPTLHHAAWALGASPEEAAALTSRPALAQAPARTNLARMGELAALPAVLREPVLLAHEHELWWRASVDARHDFDLLAAVSRRAIWLAMAGRAAEVGPVLRRAPALVTDARSRALARRGQIVLADVRTAPGGDAARRAHRLGELAAELPKGNERAWALGSQAVAMAAMGDPASERLAREALAIVEGGEVETRFRRVDLADVELRLGDPEAALEALGSDHLTWARDMWRSGDAPGGLGVRAQARMVLGQEPEPEALAMLRSVAAVHGTAYHRREWETVARALRRMRG